MKVSKWLYTVLVLLLLWLFLTGSTSIEEVIAGIVVSVLIALFASDIFTEKGLKNLTPKKIVCAILYIPYLFWEMIKANLDVAYRVLHPKMPIRPGIVMVKTRMKSDLGKLMVASSITLTPGTFTLEVDGDTFFIHWINVKAEDVEGASEQIPGKFEKCLLRFLD